MKKENTRDQIKVIFKTKSGRERSAKLSDLCEAFLKFYNSLPKTDPSSVMLFPLLKNYEKATWELVDHHPELIEPLLEVVAEPLKPSPFAFLREPSLSIKFPRGV